MRRRRLVAIRAPHPDPEDEGRATLRKVGGALVAWSFAGLLWMGRDQGAPAIAVLEVPESPAGLPSLPIVPQESRRSVATQLLEHRLWDLRAEMDASRERHAQPTLLEFDVSGLAGELEAILAEVGDAAQMSIHIRDLGSGQVLFDYFGDTPLNPASNQKLLTSSAALELLGPDYSWQTRVLRDDEWLYLVGDGDPSLQLDDVRTLAAIVAGKVDVAGMKGLVVDDSAFSRERLGPGYATDGPGWAYEAPSSALSLGFNVVEVVVEPARDRRSVRVTVSPQSSAITIRSSARIGRNPPLEVTTRRDGQRTIVDVTGRLQRGAAPLVVRRRVATPSFLCGTVFAEALASATTSEPLRVERGVAPGDAEEVASLESPTLLEILDLELAYSNNFIAEQLLRTLAWRMTGEPGDWEVGTGVLRGYWSALGGDADAVAVENGAGLGREGRLTTTAIVDLLTIAHRTAPRGQSLIDVLPIAGEPGTLHARLRLSGRRVRAKTGTLSDVSALSGVITREDGAPQLAFSILTNARDADALGASLRRSIEDRIVMAVLRRLDDYEAKRGAAESIPD